MTLSILILMCCMGRVEPSLQDAWMKAVIMWYPHMAVVKDVRWCKEPEECDRLTKMPAIAYYENENVILLRSWSWGWTDYTLSLTLAHEYGHALGLPDLTHREDSLMRHDWEEPVANGPTELDWMNLKNVEDARNATINAN